MRKMLLLYPVLLFISCSKKPDKDTDAPLLTLNTPANNQVYPSGQNIVVAGSASDNRFINQIHVVITNPTTGAEYLHVHIHPNSSSFNFNQPYTPQPGVSYKIEVIVDDASSNSTSKSVQVICN